MKMDSEYAIYAQGRHSNKTYGLLLKYKINDSPGEINNAFQIFLTIHYSRVDVKIHKYTMH